MKKAILITVLLLTIASTLGWARGEAAASSTGRGKYLAGQGMIIPPEEVHVDSYIATVDYKYPFPSTEIGITLYSGHHQISSGGQEELIQIGIQGGKQEFGELPPMNLAFVIDKSGSMSSANKMDWVKEAFDIFIERVRDIDFVALVVFDNTAKTVFSSTQMNTMTKRKQFQDAVHRINPDGGTNLVDGLKLGYQQVMMNYRGEYTNRVLFLTDGVGDSAGILEMAESYRMMGVNVSTIGVGTDFDLDLMVQLAKRGGGSSRFIADREEMEEIFGSELDRMIVPGARNLQMTLEAASGVEVLDTWGYNHQIRGGKVTYSLPTLHHRDYETIVARLRIPAQAEPGSMELARFSLRYDDLEGNSMQLGPFALEVEVVDSESPVSGFSDGMVLKSGSMLHFAENLITIGELYYSCRDEINRINEERDRLWRSREDTENVVYEELSSESIRSLERSVSSKMQRAMDLSVDTKKELNNARLRLDNEGFDEEIMILDRYIEIIGGELELEQGRVAEIAGDVEIAPPVKERSLAENVENLFREMMLNLRLKKSGIVAVSGFTTKTAESSGLLDLLNEMAVLEIGRHDTLTVVERERLSDVLAEQQLSLTDLMDTGKAIDVGKLLTAN